MAGPFLHKQSCGVVNLAHSSPPTLAPTPYLDDSEALAEGELAHAGRGLEEYREGVPLAGHVLELVLGPV